MHPTLKGVKFTRRQLRKAHAAILAFRITLKDDKLRAYAIRVLKSLG